MLGQSIKNKGVSVIESGTQFSELVPFYQDECCTIYNADCRKVLPWLDRFDLLLTDPPYGMNAMNGSRYRKRYGITSETNWDSDRPKPSTFDEMLNSADNAIIWGMNYFCDLLPPHKRSLVWHKPHIAHLPGRSDAELAFTSLEGGVDMVSMTVDSDKVHPTQKPLSLMRWCLTLCPEAKTVLDPFMGSGTTLLAAKLEGRKAVGIEVNKKYCEAAVNRLKQKVLF
jgi:DNA modification methylase